MDLRTLMTLYSLIPGAPGAQNVHKMWTPRYWSNMVNSFLNTKPGASTATPRRSSVPKPAPTYPSTNIPKVKPSPYEVPDDWTKPVPIPNAVPGPWTKPVPIPNAVPGPWNRPVPIPNAVPGPWNRPVPIPNAPGSTRFDGINWNLWGNKGIRNTLTNPNSGNNRNVLQEYYKFSKKFSKKRNDIINRGFQDWIEGERKPFDINEATRQWIEEERKPFDINEATKRWIDGERNLWK